MLRLQPSEICLTPSELLDLNLRLQSRRQERFQRAENVPVFLKGYKSVITPVPFLRRGPERSRNESLTHSRLQPYLPSTASNGSDANSDEFDDSIESHELRNAEDNYNYVKPFHNSPGLTFYRDVGDAGYMTILRGTTETPSQQAGPGSASNDTCTLITDDATCMIRSKSNSANVLQQLIPQLEVDQDSSVFEMYPFDAGMTISTTSTHDTNELRSSIHQSTSSRITAPRHLTSEERPDRSMALGLLRHGPSPLDGLAQEVAAWTAELPFRSNGEKRSTVKLVSSGKTDTLSVDFRVTSDNMMARSAMEQEIESLRLQHIEHSLFSPSANDHEAEAQHDAYDGNVYRNAATIASTMNHYDRTRTWLNSGAAGPHGDLPAPPDFAVVRGGRPMIGVAQQRNTIRPRRRNTSRIEQENDDDLDMLVSERQSWLERREWNSGGGGGLERTPPPEGRFDRLL